MTHFLGLRTAKYTAHDLPAATAWHRLIGLGATSFEPVQDVGGGIRIGAVRDPFGNILGVIENPSFRAESG
jgi:uncharacterized glyoxalase superfamily protein PhnB